MVQRRAAKFIFGPSLQHFDYKFRLTAQKLLPLMYFYELADVMFVVNSIQHPSDPFNINFKSHSTERNEHQILCQTQFQTR